MLFRSPVWCSSICRNAMNEICVEHCAIKRDCSGFEEKPNLKLVDMPRFPKTENMSRDEKFTSVTIYLAKVVDHLQGVENEQSNSIYPRPHPYRAGSRTLPENIKVQDLLPDFQEADTTPEAGEKREDEGVGSSEVVRTSD